jgi:hypothetical protein
MKNVLLLAAIAVLGVACGGAPPTQAPGASSVQTTLPEVTLGGPPVAGEPIDSTAIQSAVTALKAHDAWQFSVTLIRAGAPNTSQTINGTQRTAPQSAISAAQTVPGSNDFHYIRIGDDIWFDVGQATYTHVPASEATNLIAQYEPYYLDGLVTAAESQNYEFEPVGDESVSGVSTTHYRLSDDDVADIVETMHDITAAEWAADVWIAKDDGALMRIAWGPQSVDKAQIPVGFNYVVTSLDCACPIDPPTSVSSGG